MTETKLILNMLVPGAKMYDATVCESDKTKIEDHKLQLSWKTRAGQQKETIHFSTRGCMPAKQVIKISKEAYDNMISSTPAKGITAFAWKKLKRNERIKANLDIIAVNFNALSYTYEVLDD